MTRYHNINGELVAFTAEEETARDTEEAAALTEKTAAMTVAVNVRLTCFICISFTL